MTDYEAKVGAMQEAKEVDKQAVNQEFLKNITQHTIDDAYGKAPGWVSAKLRSEMFHKEWAKQLALIHPKIIHGTVRSKINFLRQEAAKIKRDFVNLADGDPAPIHQLVKQEFGMDLNGYTLHGIQVILIIELLKELKRVKK